MDIQQILSELSTAGAVASDYNAGGLQLQLKTNYTPAVTLYDQQGQPSALARLLGLQGGVRVLDASGNVVAQIGDWPQTNPVRVALALGAGAIVGGLVLRALRGPRRR